MFQLLEKFLLLSTEYRTTYDITSEPWPCVIPMFIYDERFAIPAEIYEKKAEKLTIYLLKFLPKLIIINNVQYLTVYFLTYFGFQEVKRWIKRMPSDTT